MKNHSLKCPLLVILAVVCLASPALAVMADYSSVPPFVVGGANPNVLLDLSIETPMQGAAYNDQPNDANGDGDTGDSGDCGGRINDNGTVGRCYFPNDEYLGIFDPNKAYEYSGGRFVPSGATNADHSTSGKWSGNFLNWATMTAIDEFRWALTGGHRVTDTTSETVLERANMGLGKGDSWYPVKMIKTGNNVAPNTVTPYGDSTIYIYNHGYQFDIGTSWGGHENAQNLNVRVLVCNATQGLEDNCTNYDDYYKPEGLIQNNAHRMRFAVMAYLLDNSQSRNGGVLRANMKYVGPFLPDGTVNPIKEYGTDGIFIVNPESATEGKSGVINYTNKFGANGYKSYDPAGELFYECLNYYKHRGLTPEYSSGLTDPMKDGFPVITNWQDPIQSSCQKNFIVGINDANPWLDKKLPGTHFMNNTFNGHALIGSDYGEPGNTDIDYSVTTWTNTVGDLQELTNTSKCIGCTGSSCNMSSTSKNIPGLGEIMGTCPYPGKENSYYIAGMAYYANTQDIRTDFSGTQTVQTFMIDTQEYNSTPLVGEMNMLWLAGKYGGFTEDITDMDDTNNDGNVFEPNLDEEWDADGDGTPDNYVLATNPQKLINGLKNVFDTINKRASSGTAASVISNTRSGEGAVYQSIFYPYLNDSNCMNTGGALEASWVGEVHALLSDKNGNMREDTNQNTQLDVLEDMIIVFEGTNVFKYADANSNSILDTAETGVPSAPFQLKDIKYLWSSNTWLNASTLIPTTQRTYSSVEKKRYIFTFIDDGDMVAETGEQVPFTTGELPTISPYLHLFDPFQFSAASPPPGVASADFTTFLDRQAERLVNYIRGEDQGELAFSSSKIPAMRSRQIDWDCSGTAETWRLGDIVYSTPTLVGTPAEDYDLLYKDTSYTQFYTKYRYRRNVVYVGGNDGMLHAFNAGFYNKARRGFDLKNLTGSETEFSLGAELWAFIPFNLLPHLYWLTRPDYDTSHVYYVDLKPRIFDAKIFAPDPNLHPNGWGTVLVCGMRLGGGIISTDKDHDGTSEANDQLMRSAYIIMDITDPEQAPKVLAEVTFSDLGFTTSFPTAFFMDPMHTNDNKWYLALGSGPIDAAGPFTTAMSNGTSNQQAKIYIIDLSAVGAGTSPLKDPKGNDLPGAGAFQTLPVGDANSFISDLIAVDLQLNYKTDAVYFGTVSGNAPTWGGKLRRIVTNDDTDPYAWVADSTLIDVQQPITAAPSIAKDDNGCFWLYFGTGRFFNRSDISYLGTQSYYGVKEPWDDTNPHDAKVQEGEPLLWTTVAPLSTQLVDVSNAVVYEGGDEITGVTATDSNSNGKISFKELVDTIAAKDGWHLNFPVSGERNLGQAAVLGDIVAFTTYTPSANPCVYEGSSNLYVPYYKTGTAYFKSVVGVAGGKVTKVIDLGGGMTTTPNLHTDTDKKGKMTTFVQTSTGAILTIEQTNPGVIKSGKISWQEEQ
ncbi:MAG: PilC/PilY family type IV pilus protein [Pseudomonadota bacterium]